MKSNIFNMYFYKEEKLENKNIIIVPKKIGNAPYRNYIRRCVKEILRKRINNCKKNFLFIFHKTENCVKFCDIENLFVNIFL